MSEHAYVISDFEQATTITVANLYYVQPILFKIADTFDVSFEEASSVATLLQAGYAAGLLLICPLGDIFRRRPFILLLVLFTATLVSSVVSPDFGSFLVAFGLRTYNNIVACIMPHSKLQILRWDFLHMRHDDCHTATYAASGWRSCASP